MWKNTSQIQSFKCAWEGFKAAFKIEPHLRFHCYLALIVLVFSAFMGLNPMEWLFIVLAIVLVIGSELLNSAIEGVVDLVTMEYHPMAKYAKDVSAAVVVCCVLGAVIIGVVIFLPKILALIF